MGTRVIKLLVHFTVLCILCSNSNAETDFEDGKFFIVSSVATGKAMTLSGGPTFPKGASVVTSAWIARDTQTWLALAESSKKEGRVIGGSKKFVLIPQQQSWNWKDFVSNGDVNITLETLPPNTMVLTLDSTAVNLTQEVYADESSQKWVVEDVGEGEVLIKNWGNQQCIRNFEKKKPSPLGTLACASEDISERWTLEPAYVLNFKSG
ncbi:uncharacterized protein LOC110847966 isoform X2 [Folsomia candida]|uniref:uncharacterized protein LOC110847966 isoform X2 n=1 Tax=Folsomia candida TaxID=158441 RepID=UPI001604EFFC|nr:uncharacterized protein LOC110847966 isoform X2 [Folsomia candida]